MPLPPGTRSAPYEIVAASILLAIPVVAFLVLQGVLGAGPVDDMFIFARYAENLAAGHGLVFNPGERVEGYSSPLWVSILGAAAALRLDVVTAAPTLSALFAVATVILVSWQASRCSLAVRACWPSYPGSSWRRARQWRCAAVCSPS